MKRFLFLPLPAFCLLLWMTSLIRPGAAVYALSPHLSETGDETASLRTEIRILTSLIREIILALPPEKQKELESTLQKVAEVEKESAESPWSETTRRLNRVKQQLEELRKKVEKLAENIQFSGFMDVQASGYRDNPNVFALGDFEFDLEKSFGSSFQVGAAFLFNEDGASLPVAFIDFHLFGGKIAPRGRLFTQKGLHFQAGRFDIPFGNDWRYNTSVDRLSVSAPLTTDLAINGGYNDIGVRVLRNATAYNYSLFCVRGVENGVALGGRLGVTPFNNPFTLRKNSMQKLEVGISYLTDLDQSGHEEEHAFALDAESAIGPLQLQMEYVSRHNVQTGESPQGWHISAFLDSESVFHWPITLFGRFDSLKYSGADPDASAPARLNRITIGAHADIAGAVCVKLERQSWLNGDEEHSGNSLFLQLAISF